jgi:Tol biopolymer transport system component
MRPAGQRAGLAVFLVGVLGTGTLAGQDASRALHELVLFQADVSGLTRVTSADADRFSGAASVSADGTRVVFHSDADFLKEGRPAGTPEIWVYEVPSRLLRRLTTASEPERRSMYPAISADGSTVVFESDSDLLEEGLPRGQREIWRYALSARSLTRVTRSAPGTSSGGAAVDATGGTIAFHSTAALAGTAPAPRGSEVWLFDALASSFTRVTTNTAADSRVSRRPALSADGRRVAFESDADLLGQGLPRGVVEIWLFDAEAGRLTRVTAGGDPSRASEAPALSADGTRLVFHSDADLLKEGRPDSVDEIWMYDVKDASLQRLTSAWVPSRDAGANAVLHPDCQYPRITADGSKVVFASDADFLGEKLPNGSPQVWIYHIGPGTLARIDTTRAAGSGVAIDGTARRMVLFRTDFDAIRALRIAPDSREATASVGRFSPAAARTPAPPRPQRLTPAQVAADLAALRAEIEGRWAYLKANGVDYRAALADLEGQAKDGIAIDEYGIDVQKFISRFIDGHSRVRGFRYPAGALPFFIEPSAGRFVAVKSDRSGLVETEFPYVTRLDGRPLADWIAAARPYSPQGSPQYRLYHALRLMQNVQFIRGVMDLAVSETVRVELESNDGARTRDLALPVAARASSPASWPRTQSRLLDTNVGYLRIASMNSAAVAEVQTWMPKFRDTRGLIVDVRGNGGGSRDALRALFPYTMAPDAPPLVVSTAKYRLHPSYEADHLGGSRFMFPETWSGWTPAERDAIVRFKRTFTPEWTPPPGEFSEWHYLVMSRVLNPRAFAYAKPVVVLMDEKCFSATDIFLSAFKGQPGVTLVGYPSGGGSARQVPIVLPESRMSMTLASMASFQRTGQLYDARGVQPDVIVHPELDYFLTGGRDNVLERALALIR